MERSQSLRERTGTLGSRRLQVRDVPSHDCTSYISDAFTYLIEQEYIRARRAQMVCLKKRYIRNVEPQAV